MMDDQRYEFLKKYLEIHGFNNIEEENLESKIIDFQKKKRLVVDGIIGPETLWALQYEPIKEKEGKIFSLERVKADKLGDGYDNFILRDDVALSYKKIYALMKEKEAIFPSSGSLRHLDLETKTYSGRSSTSLHYLGAALDIYLWAGLKDPEKDPFVLTFDEERLSFHIYAVSNLPEFPKMTISKAAYIKEEDLLTKEVTRPLFSFTDIMAKFELGPIGAYKSFILNPRKNYVFSEWWHFQASYVFTDNCSLFGIELLKIYKEEKLKKYPVWESRKAIFRGKGFYYS